MEWQPLLLSFEVGTLATLIAAVIGVAIATLLANVRFPGRELLDVLVTAPIVLPPTVLGYYLLAVVGQNSAIGQAWESLTGWRIVFTRGGLVLAATVGAVPLIIKSARAALEAVDPTLTQAARTLGASPARAFFTVQLPLAARGVLAAVMLGFAKSLGDFGVTYMVAGNIEGQTRTASIAIFDLLLIQGREGDALGMVLVLTGLAIVILYAANKLAARTRVRG